MAEKISRGVEYFDRELYPVLGAWTDITPLKGDVIRLEVLSGAVVVQIDESHERSLVAGEAVDGISGVVCKIMADMSDDPAVVQRTYH